MSNTSGQQFFEHLKQDLRQGIDRIIQHPFIKRIESGRLNKEQFQFFVEQYGIYCNYFPRFLAAAAANIPNEKTRYPIIENLWEEHGEGIFSRSHRVLFNNFALAFDLDVMDLEKSKALPSTNKCVQELFQLCLNGHFLESLGALGPGTEYFTSEEYGAIEAGLKLYDTLSEKDIEFWTVHISLDEDHYSDMEKILIPYITNEESKAMISKGAHTAIYLENIFWDGLEEHLPGKIKGGL